MRLLEAILDANTRFTGGDAGARVAVDTHTGALPLVVLSCIDPRLNQKLPAALGLPEEQFIWLRNAGNILTGPLSSTMRSIALACLIKGGKEITVIGHTDCRVAQTGIMQLTDAMKALGVERARLPENLVEYFGLFASERQNVLKAAELIRGSPLISPRLAVHGLLMDTATGRLEWVVNGYQALETVSTHYVSTIRKPEVVGAPLEELAGFKAGGMEFPAGQIGDSASQINQSHTPAATPAPAEAQAPAVTSPSGAPAGERSRLTISQRVGDRIGQTVAEKVTEFLESKIPQAQTAEDLLELLVRKVDPNRRYLLIGSDQKRYGPVSGRIVQQWVSDNRIDANTPVQMEGSTTWQTLGSLPDPKGVRLPPPIPGDSRKRER